MLRYNKLTLVSIRSSTCTLYKSLIATLFARGLPRLMCLFGIDLCDTMIVQLGLILLIKVDAFDGNHKISCLLVCSVNQFGGVIHDQEAWP